MNAEETEDCLFLDVLVPSKAFPAGPTQSSQTRKPPTSSSKAAPVLVWIDGGGFSAGYKHEQPPAGLVTRAQSEGAEGFIFVSMNYRVGLFVSAPAEVFGP